MAAKTSGRRRKKAAKRTTIAPRGNKRYVRRDGRGRIQESDDAGRSLGQDRKRRAKRSAASGQGDRGDRRTTRGKRTKRTARGSARGKRRAR
jgi:hypothetical protein